MKKADLTIHLALKLMGDPKRYPIDNLQADREAAAADGAVAALLKTADAVSAAIERNPGMKRLLAD
jgi:hypothetical protein